MRFYETKTLERIGYDFYCDIANRIVEARKRKGWTQKKLAEESKIKESKITSIEAVRMKIKLDDLEKLSKCLDVTVNWLIDAEIDSQIGECLYLIWLERLEDFKLYQRSTSKRLAFLEYERELNKAEIKVDNCRERVFVKLVGVPITDEEIRDKFPKLTTQDEEIIKPSKNKEEEKCNKN